MLILGRRTDERVVVAGGGVEVVVTVVEIRPGMVRLGFDAPPEVTILRDELIDGGKERRRA